MAVVSEPHVPVLQGWLPRRVLRLVRTGHHLHYGDLEAWAKTKANQAPDSFKIEQLP